MTEVKFESNRGRDKFIESVLNSVDNKISNEEMYVLKKYILEGDKELVDFVNDDFVLVDGKIFVKFARIFELIENSDSLDKLETICGADLDYIVATYLEKS